MCIDVAQEVVDVLVATRKHEIIILTRRVIREAQSAEHRY
jgi:hypothetical protein